jgi:putative oxidoreductase
MVTAVALMHYRILDLRETHQFMSAIPQMVAAGAGVLLLVGLWTPVSGALVAIAELFIAFSRAGDPWIPIILATLGATLAMIGPGAWSIDARLFGRKHIDLPESQ